VADTTPPPAPTPKPLQRQASSIRAEARFRERVAELGGTVVGQYVDSQTPVEVTCKRGHRCTPRPNTVLRGSGFCITCAGKDPRVAEAAFRTRIAELGGTVTGAYVRLRTPVEVVCRKGHTTTVRPADLSQGSGLCRTCAGKDPRVAEAAFRARVAELGGTVTGTYKNRLTPIDVVCKMGHSVQVWPCSVLSGQGICRTCVGKDPRVAEAAFRARIAELGGTVVGQYVNALTPVDVTCEKGHRCKPRPHDVATGNGICWACKGRSWDAFYVVQDEGLEVVKFGITNGDPRPRLREHARDGLDQVVRLHADMPDDAAVLLERTILAALRDSGEEPVRGREYFSSRVLPVVLDLVDNHPALRPLSSVSLLPPRREQLTLW